MIQLDTGLGTHFAELAQVPQVAREAEELGLGPCGPRDQTRSLPAAGAGCRTHDTPASGDSRGDCVSAQSYGACQHWLGSGQILLQDVLSWAWGRK